MDVDSIAEEEDMVLDFNLKMTKKRKKIGGACHFSDESGRIQEEVLPDESLLQEYIKINPMTRYRPIENRDTLFRLL